MSNMKVSVITVSLNCVKTIRQAIESVINQTYESIEYIIVDGGSVDGTLQVIKEFEPLFNGRMKYISEQDKGIYDAMNKGIKMSTGYIISFLNGDDWYEMDAVEQVVKYFENFKIDMLFGCANFIEKNKVVGIWETCIKEIMYRMPCCHQAVFVKREIFDELEIFDLRYKVCADYNWLLKAYNAGICIICIREILVNFRMGGFNYQNKELMFTEHVKIVFANAQKCGMQKMIPEICEKMRSEREEDLYQLGCDYQLDYIKGLLKEKESYYIWGTGDYGHRCLALFSQLRLNIKGFIDNYKSQNYINGYQVFTPEQVDKEGLICIATIKYENEIIQQLNQMKISSERFFCFSILQKQIINFVWENIILHSNLEE